MSLLDQLNPEQRDAAETTEGAVVILASAGSGKTSCLTVRCAHILETCNVRPSEVCLMTFTNKAADEMRARIEGMLPADKTRGLWAGTFHSLCGRILRQHPELIYRTRDFAIYDDDDQKVLVKQAIEETVLAKDRDQWNAELVREMISARKQEGVGPGDFPIESARDEKFVELWRTYERMLVAYNAMDFEDMINLTCQLLRRQDDVGEKWRNRFRYVMVDEFQDTNATQWELVRLLAGSGNLCVVGDDDQCAVAGTWIGTEDGGRAVESFDARDFLVGWNPGEEQLICSARLDAVEVTPFKGTVCDVYVGDNVVSVTADHRFPSRLSREHPMCVRSARRLAINMLVPVLEDREARIKTGLETRWQPVRHIVRRRYVGPVYSFAVSPEPYYVANGIVTHNSIYGWRGADVKIIRGFKEAYPDAKLVKLEQNYRSTKRIVAAAHSVIVKGKDRLDKALWTANPEGVKVTVVEGADETDEARFVGEQIRRLLQRGQSPEQMAVLYRAHSLSRVIEDELINSRIAYRVVGGFGFYDRKEVKGILSYLRLVVNPDSDVDTVRVINLPHRGIGASTVKRLRELGKSRQSSMWGAMPAVGQMAEVRPRERDAILGFRHRLERLQALSTDVHRPSEFTARLIHDTGYKRMWLEEEAEQMAAGRRQKAEEARDRAENCDSLVEAIASYERKCADVDETPSLRGYLEMVALVTKEKEATEKQAEKVTLMTVHAAKGLEFDYVWMIAMEEGRFPSSRASGNVEQEEEERRLAYVAITRARRQLWLTMASQRMLYGQLEGCSPSRFTEDLIGAEGAVEYLSTSEYRELQRQAGGEG